MMVMDTNVLSELMRQQPDCNEIQHGITRLPDGKRKSELQSAFQTMLEEELSGRVLPYDQTAAMHYGDLVTQRERIGQPISKADGQIAAICLSHHAQLATRNTKDFNHIGLDVINPWLTI